MINHTLNVIFKNFGIIYSCPFRNKEICSTVLSWYAYDFPILYKLFNSLKGGAVFIFPFSGSLHCSHYPRGYQFLESEIFTPHFQFLPRPVSRGSLYILLFWHSPFQCWHCSLKWELNVLCEFHLFPLYTDVLLLEYKKDDNKNA